jgi:hypothetical protein
MSATPVLLIGAQDVSLQERAVELYALARSHPFVDNSPLLEHLIGKHVAAGSAELPPEVVAAAQKRGRSLDWWETAEALREELRKLGWAAHNE